MAPFDVGEKSVVGSSMPLAPLATPPALSAPHFQCLLADFKAELGNGSGSSSQTGGDRALPDVITSASLKLPLRNRLREFDLAKPPSPPRTPVRGGDVLEPAEWLRCRAEAERVLSCLSSSARPGTGLLGGYAEDDLLCAPATLVRARLGDGPADRFRLSAERERAEDGRSVGP